MAIGGLISNRDFGSFIGAGKVYQTEQRRGERLDIATARFAHGIVFYRKFHSRIDVAFTSRFSCSPLLQVTNNSNEKILKSSTTYSQKISLGRCSCSSYPSVGNWIQLRMWPGQHLENVKVNRTRAAYKSEEYDITEASAESFKSGDGSSEAILIEGNLHESSWWEQFPKRWVIVLLCFMAFLLCNMDRVNMSIAILPMSQEFHWNSATVGLIQSSFFWGYLMTQILGGIWADKLGGKLVLGFGVIWWSIATVLTPIAAKVDCLFC